MGKPKTGNRAFTLEFGHILKIVRFNSFALPCKTRPLRTWPPHFTLPTKCLCRQNASIRNTSQEVKYFSIFNILTDVYVISYWDRKCLRKTIGQGNLQTSDAKHFFKHLFTMWVCMCMQL